MGLNVEMVFKKLAESVLNLINEGEINPTDEVYKF